MAVQAHEGYELLRCPEAIPTSAWLRNSALWANNLSAIWPRQQVTPPRGGKTAPMQPTPRNAGEEAAMQDIVALQSANLFTPRLAPDLSEEASRLSLRLGELTSNEATPWRAAWQLPEAESSASGAGEFATTLLTKKLDDNMVKQLIGRGLLRPGGGGTGYIASEQALVPWLVTEAAQSVARKSDGAILPVPSGRFLGIAEPLSKRGDAVLGMHLSLPVLPPIRSDVPLHQLIDLRMSDRFDRHRLDYLAQLADTRAALETKYTGQPAAAIEAKIVAKQVEELARTYVTYRTTLSQHGWLFDLQSTFTSEALGLVLNLASGELPSQPWQFFATAAAFIVTPVIIRRSAPAFLRSVSGLLDAPAV